MQDERAAPATLTDSEVRRQGGMSLIEVLIAVALMTAVSLSLLPLFSRSIRQNREGGNFTDLTNVARSTLEEHIQLDFNATQLVIPVGQEQRTTTEYWDAVQRRWLPLADPTNPPAGARFQRSVQVQQYAAGDLLNNGWLDDPLDGGAGKDNVHLKVIRVTVRPLWSNFELGRPTPIVLELMKAI
jgi:prepilin-type N-terminal cleavage/methylation domain-containing protein